MTKVRIRYFVMFALLVGSRLPSTAHAQEPLSAIFQNLPTADDGDDIWSQAAQAQSTAGPKYTSTAIEMKTFEGTFVPATNNAELWVFSDDGVNVQVKLDEIPGPGDTKQLSKKGNPQHLPTQAQSLHKVPFSFVANQLYGVRVEYQNIVYNGESDIDGCTLFSINGNAGELEVDLDAYEVADADEEDPGACVVVNLDDDNGNQTPDKDEDPVSGEDDLLPLAIDYTTGLSSGTLQLDVIAGASKVKIWDSANKATQLTLPKTWDLSSETPPTTVYLEGVARSDAPRDVTVELKILESGSEGTDLVKVTIVGVDLDAADVADADEEDPGACVTVNHDDDNDNQTADKDENPVTGEDDLLPLTLDHTTGVTSGTLRLDVTAGGSKVKIWDSATKGTQLTLPKTWDLSSETPPTTVYLEGVAASDSERDVTVELKIDEQVCGDIIKVTVVEVDLDAAGVADADEEDPGACVAVNLDDDNGNQTADKDENPVTGEDDLLPLTIDYSPNLASGTLTLDAIAGASKVKIWDSATKETQLTLPKTWDLSSETPPTTAYLEGIVPSDSPRDVTMELKIEACGNEMLDTVKVTIAGVDLDAAGVADADEEDPGAFVVVNNDDDNDNQTADKDEDPVTGEDDLLPLTFNHTTSVTSGTLRLDVTAGASKVKIWDSATKGTQLTLPKTWDLSSETPPTTVYLEGVAASDSPRDVTVELKIEEQECGDIVKVTVIEVDLDIDSDNNGTIEEADDPIEDDASKPGKYVVANVGDKDGDGIVDFADGFDLDDTASNDDDQSAGVQFVRLVLDVKQPIDMSVAKIKISYERDSNPAGVTESNGIYTPAAGNLRIWKKDGGGVKREKAAANAAMDPGDYVPPGDYEPAELGLSVSKRSETLFVEGIRPSTALGAEQITVEVDPDGTGPAGFEVSDAVRVTVVKVDLDVDTDRDGTVGDDQDEQGEDDWVKNRGAIYAVNFDRDGARTTTGMPTGLPIPDAIHFNDSGAPVNEDYKIENDDDKEDIAKLVIRKIAPEIPSGWKVYLKAAELEDVRRVHVYKKIEADPMGMTNPAIWGSATGAAPPLEIEITNWIDPSHPDFQGDAMSGDTTFGIEGLFFRYTGASVVAGLEFDGEIDLTLELRDGAAVIQSDSVRLKVAPWIMLSRKQASEEIWAVDAGTDNDEFRLDAIADPDPAPPDDYKGLDNSGQLETASGAAADNQWFQDHIEIGFTQRPHGPKTHVVFRLPYVANPTWPLTKLLKKDVGTFQLGADLGGDEGDFGGNLEVLPPNKSHKLGRIAMGNTVKDTLKNFLTSQEVQEPIFDVPVSWLAVGHIDEVTSFLKDKKVAIADPTLAWDLISDATKIPVADRFKSVFFATGAQPEGGTVGSSSDDRLYDGPATGSITTVAPATSATGSITTIAEGDLVDGETFTISNGTTSTTFEFDLPGDGIGADVAIDLSAGGASTANDVRDAVITAINGVTDFCIDAETDGAAKVKLTNLLPGTAGNVAIAETVADGGFTVTGMAGGADDGILDGETITLKEGTATKVFEFDTCGGVTMGNVRVDISAATSADDVRDALVTAINATAGLTISAIADGAAKIHLWNTTKGTAGNQTITETVTNAGFSVAGMSGGKPGGRDFTTTAWVYVRTFTMAAGKPSQGQVAHISGRHDGWIEIDEVWATTSKIVDGSSPDFDIDHWSKFFLPTTTTWDSNPSSGDKYVVCEGTRFWYNRFNPVPAIVTVEEVLADDDFEDLNKTDIQNVMDGAMGANVKEKLQAATPADTLTFINVPGLFFGTHTGFSTTGRTAVAFNPGPTNLQQVAGKLYVPRQFGPRGTTGASDDKDLYEQDIKSALGPANLFFVDDWDLYHRLDGEVHCGSNVKRAVLSIDWWANQP